ncbi:sugar phosphate nucleotidyltransferase [Streptococcus danieliae]|uniref:sugar phosphate nucleotidyltransferase n=1 Tax=Streptococcus danieliae TaxID=747656 RepID=UPI0021C5AB6D|nr:sugar phosphate nucleotidyltransferase [Streptococcus danieliae]MCU0082023.1 sugar phosphate nucleotidyltransferase [Streptococcus danieliae]
MRAIILAAGMGTRLRPLTLAVPKSLVEIQGETLIERQIRFLKERSITEIIVVTGYLSEKFDFLREKYDVTLIHNEKYDRYNNFYTMYLVREFLDDAYVIDADNYLVENFLEKDIQNSTYFSVYKTGFTDEWLLKYDQQDRVTDVVIESGEGNILSGISYWNHQTGQHLQSLFESYYASQEFQDLYWDNLVMNHLDDLEVFIKKIPSNAIFEIDNLDDLQILRKFMEE